MGTSAPHRRAAKVALKYDWLSWLVVPLRVGSGRGRCASVWTSHRDSTRLPGWVTNGAAATPESAATPASDPEPRVTAWCEGPGHAERPRPGAVVRPPRPPLTRPSPTAHEGTRDPAGDPAPAGREPPSQGPWRRDVPALCACRGFDPGTVSAGGWHSRPLPGCRAALRPWGAPGLRSAIRWRPRHQPEEVNFSVRDH